MGKKLTHSICVELLRKSREAALNAVQTFNNPLTTFKTETFIVLMVIAWTYLLHAHYRRLGIEYRYHRKGSSRRRFERTKSGAFKYWELERCLNEEACPLDEPAKNNIRFLIGLRHEIEHHGSTGSDRRFSGRYLACCLNYERYICSLFGGQHSLGEAVAFTLQFRDITRSGSSKEATQPLPSNVSKYLKDFDGNLPEEQLSSPFFRSRFLFVPVIAKRLPQADEVIEFVPLNSELGRSINEAHQQIYVREVERAKHLPTTIVKLMHQEGYVGFGIHQHTLLWKKLNAKNPGKGFGVLIAKTWYWYDRWVDKVREHCAKNKARYGFTLEGLPTQ